MTLGYTTIVTPILAKRVDELKHYLRKSVEPQFDPVEIIKCQNSFPFDQIKGLHFCSMVILPGVDQSDSSCLVFEATFDGTREEFLDDLLRVAPKGIHAIYGNCGGYPESGLEVPELIKDYLVRHDVGAQTFYSGSPGRSVAQIKGEAHIHKEIVSFVGSRRAKVNPPTTHLDLQRELQHEVIRKRPSNQWAEQPAVVPWEVTQRAFVASLVALALLAAACGVGGLALLFGAWGPGDIYKGIVSLAHEPLIALISLIAVWMILRKVELVFDNQDPSARRFLGRYAVLGLAILRYYVLVVLLLSLAVQWLYTTSVRATPTLIAICLLLALAVIWLVLRARATSLKLLIQFKELTPPEENLRRYRLDVVRFLMAVIAGFALLVVGSYLPDSITRALGFLAVSLFVLSFYGVLTAYLLGFAPFLVVRCLELADRRRFAPATELVTKDPSVYEREEGGVNRYQNHLASLTYVKPGILRAGFLRLTLLAIGLLSRFWFNRGRLGGIQTILAARWVLIEGAGGGLRLLFLTNYGGAWESYLNEFIDMGAVIGLNGIWSNTFVKVDNTERGYAFPETKFYFWKGAEAEKPFKAYVRHSQIETIVWYSAYPTLRIINLNSSTDLRQALFKPLAPCELDSVFHNAGL